jgi:DegT/DnrJ/EryC1/StrS aminotransferase family
MNAVKVPFFRPDLTEDDLRAVVGTLRSGWLTTGPQVGRFEAEFAEAVGAPHAVAVNSCTAALHLAVEALGLRAGELVLVPAMTFAATAEVVRYVGAVPLLVDCDPETLNLDLGDAGWKVEIYELDGCRPPYRETGGLAGVISVHVGPRGGGRVAASARAAGVLERHAGGLRRKSALEQACYEVSLRGRC